MISHHSLTESLLQYKLIPNDATTVSALDNALFDLNSQYKAKQVINAGYSVLRTMLARNNNEDPINDCVSYITDAIVTSIGNNQNKNSTNQKTSDSSQDTADLSSNENNVEELEQLKIARAMKKHKCTFEEAKKILEHDRESRKNMNLGDSSD